jgi:hypothetical protein
VARIAAIAHEERGRFEALPGLREKAFTVDEQNRRAINLYLWGFCCASAVSPDWPTANWCLTPLQVSDTFHVKRRASRARAR